MEIPCKLSECVKSLFPCGFVQVSKPRWVLLATLQQIQDVLCGCLKGMSYAVKLIRINSVIWMSSWALVSVNIIILSKEYSIFCGDFKVSYLVWFDLGIQCTLLSFLFTDVTISHCHVGLWFNWEIAANLSFKTSTNPVIKWSFMCFQRIWHFFSIGNALDLHNYINKSISSLP